MDTTEGFNDVTKALAMMRQISIKLKLPLNVFLDALLFVRICDEEKVFSDLSIEFMSDHILDE